MAEIWGAAIAAAATVGSAAYSANQQKKAQSEANRVAGESRVRPGKLPAMPGYMPFDYKGASEQAIKEDADFYSRTDRDFAKRHPWLLEAEGLAEKGALADQQGESELMPAVQNEFMRGGLQNALTSLGSEAVLTPGSAGEANIGRHLGVGILNFQDRNRRNRNESLRLAEDISPRRTFGMSGADLVSALMTENADKNDFNQSNYAATVANQQYQDRFAAQESAAKIEQANANARATAATSAATAQAISGAVTGVAGAYGKYKTQNATPSSLAAKPVPVTTPQTNHPWLAGYDASGNPRINYPR